MTTPIFATIPERIAWARTQADVNPSLLSEAAGLDRSHVRLIEGGGKRTAAETVGKIATALNITTDWLISGVGEAPDPAALHAVGVILKRRAAEAPVNAEGADAPRDSQPATVG